LTRVPFINAAKVPVAAQRRHTAHGANYEHYLLSRMSAPTGAPKNAAPLRGRKESEISLRRKPHFPAAVKGVALFRERRHFSV
jgi:hypothetical protein